MNISEQQVLQLIENGERINVEFKECNSGLARNVYETICAFINRNGGTLLLGVNDKGLITGIQREAINQIRKDFSTTINNAQKINPPCYLSMDDHEIEGKLIIHVFVPESSQVHRCTGRIYDRNEDGGLDITDHTFMVGNLYHRKYTLFSENKIYPYAELTDLRSDLFEKTRLLARILRKDHPWLWFD
ncbi:MAG: putative DNA binding domain-containing protein [Legionellaceae bacterium]|nr:putative DNA binding domain-containing protein [Legionellaceae bacterium]